MTAFQSCHYHHNWMKTQEMLSVSWAAIIFFSLHSILLMLLLNNTQVNYNVSTPSHSQMCWGGLGSNYGLFLFVVWALEVFSFFFFKFHQPTNSLFIDFFEFVTSFKGFLTCIIAHGRGERWCDCQ